MSKQYTPNEELTFIKKVIEDSRATFSEDGKPFIAWGIIVALGCLSTYFEAVTDSETKFSSWIWIGLSALGLLYVLTYKFRHKDEKRATNLADRLQGSLWGSVGGTIGIVLPLLFISYSINPERSIHPIFACSIIAMILGIAYYMSGSILQIKWLRNVSFAWWIGGVAMYLMFSVHVLAIYSLMLLAFQVVPGIILYRKYTSLQRSLSVHNSLA